MVLALKNPQKVDISLKKKNQLRGMGGIMVIVVGKRVCDTKVYDGVAPVLQLWGILSTFSFPLLSGPLWSER